MYLESYCKNVDKKLLQKVTGRIYQKMLAAKVYQKLCHGCKIVIKSFFQSATGIAKFNQKVRLALQNVTVIQNTKVNLLIIEWPPL